MEVFRIYTNRKITEIVLEQLSALGLSLENKQGYNNGSNMKGIHSDVQARIKKHQSTGILCSLQ